MYGLIYFLVRHECPRSIAKRGLKLIFFLLIRNKIANTHHNREQDAAYDKYNPSQMNGILTQFLKKFALAQFRSEGINYSLLLFLISCAIREESRSVLLQKSLKLLFMTAKLFFAV